jgi:hypothetical protein
MVALLPGAQLPQSLSPFCYGGREEAGLGRKSGSYKFEKRQKELKKQKKKMDKLARRQNKDDEFEDDLQPATDPGQIFEPTPAPDAEPKSDA